MRSGIARTRVGDPLKLILEVTGAKDRDKAAKVDTAKKLWVPAVNNAAAWGRWAFLEITDPWDAETTIRAAIGAVGLAGVGLP